MEKVDYGFLGVGLTVVALVAITALSPNTELVPANAALLDKSGNVVYIGDRSEPRRVSIRGDGHKQIGSVCGKLNIHGLGVEYCWSKEAISAFHKRGGDNMKALAREKLTPAVTSIRSLPRRERVARLKTTLPNQFCVLADDDLGIQGRPEHNHAQCNLQVDYLVYGHYDNRWNFVPSMESFWWTDQFTIEETILVDDAPSAVVFLESPKNNYRQRELLDVVLRTGQAADLLRLWYSMASPSPAQRSEILLKMQSFTDDVERTNMLIRALHNKNAVVKAGYDTIRADIIARARPTTVLHEKDLLELTAGEIRSQIDRYGAESSFHAADTYFILAKYREWMNQDQLSLLVEAAIEGDAHYAVKLLSLRCYLSPLERTTIFARAFESPTEQIAEELVRAYRTFTRSEKEHFLNVLKTAVSRKNNAILVELLERFE